MRKTKRSGRLPFFEKGANPMRINGRTLRPSTLAERRLMLSFGLSTIRVPRNRNPFIVARRLGRLARHGCPDGEFFRQFLQRLRKPPYCPIPNPDFPDPVDPDLNPTRVAA